MNAEMICYPELDCDGVCNLARGRSVRSRVDCPGSDAMGKGRRGRALYCGGAGTEPLDTFFVPVTRVGYEVDLASLFGYRY